MRIPEHLYNPKLTQLPTNIKSAELEHLLNEPSESAFLAGLPQLKPLLKSENCEASQIIALLDKLDGLLSQTLSSLMSLSLPAEPEFKPSLTLRRLSLQASQAKILTILKTTCWILSTKTFNKVYHSLERVLQILTLCDDFEVLEHCMLLMYGYFSDDNVISSNFAYCQGEIEDLLFICKYTLNHLNSFSSNPTVEFSDFFRDDLKYPDFREIALKNHRSIIEESPVYDSSLDFDFLSSGQYQRITLPDLQALSSESNLLNSLDVTQFLRAKHEVKEFGFQPDKPVENKRVFYGLLCRVRFALNHVEFKQRVSAMGFILGSLQTFVALTKLYSLEKNQLLNKVFVTNLDFGTVLREVLNLFYLELTPQFHTKVVLTILNILALDEHFDFKEYMNQINAQFIFLQRLFKDCLARKITLNAENKVVLSLKTEKNRVLAEKTALNSKFLDKMLLLLKKEVKQFYLDEENNIITTQIYSMCILLGSMMELNEFEVFTYQGKSYFPYTYKHLLTLNETLWNLIPNQDLLTNYNLFDRLIERLIKDLNLLITSPSSAFVYSSGDWRPVKLPKLTTFIEYMIKLIDSPFFRKISMRNQSVPTLARKIADSEILVLLKKALENEENLASIEKIFLQTMTLVGDIAREIPGLLDRLIDLGIMKTILVKLSIAMPRNVESIPMIIYFLNMLCLNERGQSMELEADSFTQVFLLFIRRDFIPILGKTVGHNGNKCPSSMAYEFLELLNSVDKLKPRVCELVLWTFKQLRDLKNEILRRIKGTERMSIESYKNSDAYEKSFPLESLDSIEKEGVFTREAVETLADYNRILGNFLRFFSRFFSVNCNIIDELINGHCIDLFLELIDSPLLLFAEKGQITHSLAACFKVFIINIYKGDLNEKITEEIQKVMLNIETQVGNVEKERDFGKVMDYSLYAYYLNKNIIDSEVKIDRNRLIFIGKLQTLENLNEFLRLMISSKHIQESPVPNKNLLIPLSRFLKPVIRDLIPLGHQMISEEKPNRSFEAAKKALTPLLQTLKRVFVMIIKETLDNQFRSNKEVPQTTSFAINGLVEVLGFCLEEALALLRDITLDLQAKIDENNLFSVWILITTLREFLQAYIEPFKRNIVLHPGFTFAFFRASNHTKLIEFLERFQSLYSQHLQTDKTQKSNAFLPDLLRKIQEDLSYVMRSVFFSPLEIGFTVHFPESGTQERGEPVAEFLGSVTLENLRLVAGLLRNTRDLYVIAKLHPEMKESVELPLGLLLKALKLTNHSQRKSPVAKRKNPHNQDLLPRLEQMGFERKIIEEALENVDSNDIEIVTTWIITNQNKPDRKTRKPEEPERFFQRNEKVIEKNVRRVNKEEFLAEKRGLVEEIAEDLLRKVLFLEDFDDLLLGFLKLVLERPELEDLRKAFGSKYLYLLLRSVSRLSQSVLKKFTFKFGLKCPSNLKEQLRSSEFITDLPSSLAQSLGLSGQDLILRNFNIILPVFTKLMYRIWVSEKTDKNTVKIRPVNEILRMTEKLIESQEGQLRKTAGDSLRIWQEFLLKVLLLGYEVLDFQEKNRDLGSEKPKKKLRSKAKFEDKPVPAEMKDFYTRLISLIIKLLAIHNSMNSEAEPTQLLINSLPNVSFKILRACFQLPGAKENIGLFIMKKGLHEILKVKGQGSDFPSNAELLRRIFESIILSDADLLSAHYELKIKQFFLSPPSPASTDPPTFRKEVPLNEFLAVSKDTDLNPSLFSAIAKRICLKTRSKNDANVKISLREEFTDISKVLNPKEKPNTYANSVKSIYQPFPDTHTLVFLENDVLNSVSSSAPGDLILRQPSGNQGIPGKVSVSVRKSSRKTSKSIKKEDSKRKGRRKEEDKENGGNDMGLAIEFQPSEGLQSIIGLVLESIVNQFLEELSIEETNALRPAFSYTFLLKLLHTLIRKFPVLVPFILKYNCGKNLKKHSKIRFDFPYKEISFLSFLLKVVVPLTLDKFRPIIFELCLDNYLYFPSLTHYSHEIRKKSLLEIYLGLEKELQIVSSQGLVKGLSPNNQLIPLITLHSYLLPIRDIAAVSVGWGNERLGLNFLRLYSELFKLISLKEIYSIESEVELLTEPLSILYQYLLAFALNKKAAQSPSTLMPHILSNRSALISEWEYMMNPTVFPVDPSLEPGLQIDESESSYSSGDYSIDSFMNELYHYNSNSDEVMNEQLPEAAIEEESDSEGSEDSEMENLEPASESNTEEEMISGEEGESGPMENQPESSESDSLDSMSSPHSSESYSGEGEERPSSESSPSSSSQGTIIRGERRIRSFHSSSEDDEEDFDDDLSSEDEEEADELIEMSSDHFEDEGNLGELANNGGINNRRRFLGSVNFIFRRDRVDRGEGRGRPRGRREKERKKAEKESSSLRTIGDFSHLQFDPEIMKVNDQFREILYRSKDSTLTPESWELSLRRRLYDRIFEDETAMFGPEPPGKRIHFPIQQSLHEALENRRSHLNLDVLMNSAAPGMVMLVSGGGESGVIDLNAPGSFNRALLGARRPGIFARGSDLGLRGLIDDFEGQNEESENQRRQESERSGSGVDELRERIMRDLSEIGRDNEEEEEQKEMENNERGSQRLDPLFLDIMNHDLRNEGLEGLNLNSNTSANLAFEPIIRSNNNNSGNPPGNNNNLISQGQSCEPQGGQQTAQDIDNATFFASLPPELREEVLMSSDPAFLGTLPPDILSEFNALRSHQRLIPNLLLGHEEESGSFSESELFQRPKKIQRKEKKREGPACQKQKEILLKNPSVAKSLVVEERVLENIVNFLYVDSLAFKLFPFAMMRALMAHPVNERRILDCFLGLLKGEISTQDLLERDHLVSDKHKVFANISLKILTILAVHTKHTVSSYFLEKSHKTLILEKNSPNSVSPLREIIAMLGNRDFTNSYVHLKLLIALIANVSRRVRDFNERKTHETEKFKLEPDCIASLCNLLSSDILDDRSLRNLNNIISVFSLNRTNLQDFVAQMKAILLSISEKMNVSLEENLLALRKVGMSIEGQARETEENLINRLESEIEDEHKIYRIFKIIKKLFEKCLKKSVPKKPVVESQDPMNPEIEEEKEPKDPEGLPQKEQDEGLSSNAELRKTFKILISDRALNNVWINVTELLILINEACPKSINLSNPIIHKMTPIIECFFIIYRILNDEESSFDQHRQSSHALRKYYSKKTMPEISSLIHNLGTEEGPAESELRNLLNNREKLTFNDMFTIMCEKNKNIINMMVKQNVGLLTESFSMIIKKMPKILDFDNKKNYFRSELKKLKPSSYPSLRMKVRRSTVFIDSYNVIRNLKTEELRRKLVVEFINEPGVDQGGLIREFYSLLSREIFNPGYCLFKTSANNVTFQPSPQSYINDQHLNYFKFVGRLFGKALHDGFMMDAFFTRSFYKHMLGQSLTIYDMEDIDPEYFKNLKWILENDISPFELTFSYESDNFGKIEVVDLIPNGRNIPVTEENKLDYVQKICYAKMAKDIQEQIKKFLEGFHELIPPTLVGIFDSRELELMISGLPDIDSTFLYMGLKGNARGLVQDLKENTEYTNYSKDSRVILWLWEILGSLDKSDKAAFLQFVTGTSKVPLEGFKGLRGANGPKKFNIQKCFDMSKLPSSHTCFNQLDLPDYESKEVLSERLLIAIREGKEFGFM